MSFSGKRGREEIKKWQGFLLERGVYKNGSSLSMNNGEFKFGMRSAEFGESSKLKVEGR